MPMDNKILDAPSKAFLESVIQNAYPSKRDVVSMAAFSLILSATYVVVYWMDGTSKAECFWIFCGLACVLFVAVSIVSSWLIQRQFQSDNVDIPGKCWLLFFGILITSYGIALAANFPGVLSVDSYASIGIAIGEDPLSNAHPMFYTALVVPFAQLGNAVGDMGIGIFLFSVVQMVATAAVCAYACLWLSRHGVPCLAVLFVLAFFAFNPVIAKYAITMWKDIPFALCMLLAFLQIFDIALSKGEALKFPKNCLKLAITTLFICLLRNNGIYAMALVAICMAVVWRRFIRGSLSVFAAIALAYVIAGPFYSALGVEPSPFRESVGIPIQQLSAVVAYDGAMTDEQLETLSDLVDVNAIKEFHNPYSTNPVKYHESFNDEWLNTHRSEFMDLWLEVGLQNPVVYLQAWMRATQGYWNMETHSWVVSEGGVNLLYEATGLAVFDGSPTTQFTALRSSSPVSLLFNMGFVFWVTVFVAIIRCSIKQYDLIVPLVAYAGLWGTMLIAAPYFCEFRYMFPLYLAFPIILATAFLKPPLKGRGDK